MNDEQLVVMLEARVAEFERRMRQAEGRGTRTYGNLRRGSRSATAGMERDMVRSTTRINQALATTTARVGGMSKAFLGGLAGTAITAGIAALTTGLAATVKGIAAVGDEARRAGVNVTAFQEWRFVAEQNRIGIDSMTDGLKELNLRADEFITTGSGSASEAFQRLGFNASELKTKLENPSELLLEIIGRLGDLDTAAQIRVSDEIFGGAGERFVELIDQGEAGLRATIDRAHEVGAVMDEEMIAKAAELDRRFGEVQTRLGAIAKTISVEVADAMAGLIGAAGAVKNALSEPFDQTSLGRMGAELPAMIDGAYSAAQSIEALSFIVSELDGSNDAAADSLDELVDRLRDLAQRAATGTIEAGDLQTGLVDVGTAAESVLTSLQNVDGIDLTGAMGAVAGLLGVLRAAAQAAATLSITIPGGGAVPRVPGDQHPPTMGTPLAPKGSPRPRGAPPLVDDYNRPSAGDGGGGGGGGGAAKVGQYQAITAAIKEQTIALQLEAAELVAVAAGGQTMGDALIYAKKRAEMLNAAMKEGREITPELRAEIDQLAIAYTRAGQDAETAADKLQLIEDQARRGADRLTDLFSGIASGSLNAKDAVIQLLLELAKMQIAKGLLSIGQSGGILGTIVQAFGFSSGGYTGDGGKLEPAGVVHKGEFVVNAAQVRKPGVRASLEAINSGSMPTGQATGGGGVSSAAAPQEVNVTVSVDQSGNLKAFVQRESMATANALDENRASAYKQALPGWLRDHELRRG